MITLKKGPLSGEALKSEILRPIKELPPMPQSVFKAREIMANPKSSFKELGQILERDQGIATAVLKFANSAYYGLSGRVSSIQRASVVLGHKTIAELITVAAASRLLGKKLDGYDLGAGELWRHSLGVACASKIIANMKNSGLANDVFTAGLIHDAGKLILGPYILEWKEEFQQFMADGRKTFLNAEREILGFDHSQIAAEVCKNWLIPQPLATAIEYHHYPSRSQGSELAYIVHVADAIAMMTGLGLGADGLNYQMDDKAVEFLGLQRRDISNIMVEILAFVEKTSEEMSSPG